MEKDALMELGAHTAALISRSTEYVRGIRTADQVAVGKLRNYVSATEHMAIDLDEVTGLFQNIRRRYEAIPEHAKFTPCEDIQVIYSCIDAKFDTGARQKSGQGISLLFESNRKARQMGRHYSPQFKEQALAYVQSHPEQCITQVAQHLGIGNSTLDKWVRSHKQKTNQQKTSNDSAEQKRISALEQEVKYLKEVNDILKKAHVYFINNPSQSGTRI
jgi:transposase